LLNAPNNVVLCKGIADANKQLAQGRYPVGMAWPGCEPRTSRPGSSASPL